jgi:hypothetical protein
LVELFWTVAPPRIVMAALLPRLIAVLFPVLTNAPDWTSTEVLAAVVGPVPTVVPCVPPVVPQVMAAPAATQFAAAGIDAAAKATATAALATLAAARAFE